MHYVTLGLALLWKYYFLALENILSLVLLLLLYFLLFLIFFSLLYSEISLCNLYYFCYSNNVLLIIVKFCLSKIKFTYLISHQNPKVNNYLPYILKILFRSQLVFWQNSNTVENTRDIRKYDYMTSTTSQFWTSLK